ncbi:TPA: amino acid permease, partial [Enterobacter cloacae]|nr:amino acid permease [Enterobacter cloacae]HAV2292430.1 amino acid permease [Enterobacter cloacae]HAV2321874.1 amino acid permease [Enterobacter cloacae]HCC6150535.1 amino acid permease [Enterobacter cloacae]HCC7650019.1 amino acid permease [Enterobacter cloacae]
AALKKSMPAVFARENRWRVPSSAVWLTNIAIQLFLIITFFSDYAFLLALELTSAMTLIPYLLVAAYSLKLVITRETYEQCTKGYYKDLVISVIATAYAFLMIYAGGLTYVLLSAVIYAPGTLLYYIAKREQNKKIFSGTERILFTAIVLAALACIYGIINGNITI